MNGRGGLEGGKEGSRTSFCPVICTGARISQRKSLALSFNLDSFTFSFNPGAKFEGCT